MSPLTLCVQESGPSLNFEEARKICLLQVVKDLACVQLIYGRAGWFFLGNPCILQVMEWGSMRSNYPLLPIILFSSFS